jgi:hypothetical protein
MRSDIQVPKDRNIDICTDGTKNISQSYSEMQKYTDIGTKVSQRKAS